MIIFSMLIIIVLSYVKKINIGLLSIAASALISYTNGITTKELLSGFSSSLFITLLGVLTFFTIIQISGALDVACRKIVVALKGRRGLIPFTIFVLGFILAAIGPGTVPAMAFIAVMAVPLSHSTGYNSTMLMIIGMIASFAGRFTAITPEGVLISTILHQYDISINLLYVVMNATFGAGLLAIIIFLLFRFFPKLSLNLDKMDVTLHKESLTNKQKLSIFSIVLLLLGVVFLKINVGLMAFILSVCLLLFRVADEKTVVSNISWSTLIMIVGVGLLINLSVRLGEVDFLVNEINQISSPTTIVFFTSLTAGVMSWFSSTIGVVLPTMLPIIAKLEHTASYSFSAVEMVSSVGIISSVAGFSPMSTVGALILATNEADTNKHKITQEALFFLLLSWSVFSVFLLSGLSYVGFFSFG